MDTVLCVRAICGRDLFSRGVRGKDQFCRGRDMVRMGVCGEDLFGIGVYGRDLLCRDVCGRDGWMEMF